MNEGRPPSTAWRTVRFGDVVRNVDEAVRDPLTCGLERFVGLEHIDPESLRIKRWGQIADGTSFTRKFTAGQALFGKRRAYQRKVAVADFDGLCSSDILVFAPADGQLLPELLPFIVQTEGFFQHALGTSAGSLSPRTRWRDLAAYEFPLPPLDEQRRIAEILWAAEDSIAANDLVLHDMYSLRSVLIDARISGSAKGDSDRGEWSDSPDGVRLRDACTRIVDGPHNPPEFTSSGIPFLLVSNLSSGAVDWNVSKWVSPETYDDLKRRIGTSIGDVLYTVVGSFGVPVLVTWTQPFAFQRHIGLIKPNAELLDGAYLAYFLESRAGKKQAEVAATGNAQRTITLQGLGDYLVPLPPLSRQREIVTEIGALDSGVRSLIGHQKDSQDLKKRLIHFLLCD